MKKRFCLFAEEEKLDKIKAKAKEENRSTNSFILNRIIDAPNVKSGNFWDDPDTIRKLAKQLKKELKNGK